MGSPVDASPKFMGLWLRGLRDGIATRYNDYVLLVRNISELHSGHLSELTAEMLKIPKELVLDSREFTTLG